MKKILIFSISLLCWSAAHGQVRFSTYSDDDLVLNMLGSGEIEFNWILPNETRSIGLGDEEMVVMSITGVEYYDVIVTIDAPDNLVLDGENVLAFTLNAAYANRGQNQVGDARLISGDVARFPIKGREGGQPPGPPPTPDYEGYTPPEATAYLFLYGTITAGQVHAGEYTGTINITVEYD
ncbi:MAG: hypothetical protein WEB89_01335 [Balneolales bacterium]